MCTKRRCTAAIVDHGKTPIVLDGIENSGPGIHRLYQRLVEEGCSTVVMESTGPYWIGLYDYLDLRGVNTVTVSPRSLKAFGGKKTDEHDAVWLAHLYRIDLLKPSYVPPRHIRELRSLTRRLEKIVQMMSATRLLEEGVPPHNWFELIYVRCERCVEDCTVMYGP